MISSLFQVSCLHAKTILILLRASSSVQVMTADSLFPSRHARCWVEHACCSGSFVYYLRCKMGFSEILTAGISNCKLRISI